jgi:hypothetical protein
MDSSYISFKLESSRGNIFPDSNRVLIIDADGNVTTISLRDISRHSMPHLHLQLSKIRQLVVSPKEQLVAICSDLGLIIHGLHQTIDGITLLSNGVHGAKFSPDGAYLYTLEFSAHFYIMISRVDTQNWTVQRILPETVDYFHINVLVPIYSRGRASIELDTIMADGLSALRVSWEQHRQFGDIFLDFSTGRQIIPPSSSINGCHLRYRGQWLMRLPIPLGDMCKTVMNQDHLAYIDQGKVFVLDHSSLIKQM